ncbi:hypothetical protein P7C73_g4418, partial [Tremellales sp. Uapishka_1]
MQASFEGITTPASTVCHWPLQVISDDRDLDLTICFELAVLLPLPLLVAIVAGSARLFQIRRAMKKSPAEGGLTWRTRSERSETISKVKMYLLGFSATIALISCGLSAPSIPRDPLPSVHYLLLSLACLTLLHLTHLNYHTSRTSSAVVLLFIPAYILFVLIRLRTLIITRGLSTSHNSTIDIVSKGLWLTSVGILFVDFILELFGPEKKWGKLSWTPWSRQGKIKLDEEDDEVPELDGSSNVYDDEKESPVLVANIYESDSAESLSFRLSTAWKEQQKLVSDGKKKAPSLKIAIFKAYGFPYFIAGVLKIAYDCLSFLQPQLLRLLLSFVSSYGTDHPMSPAAGFGISILMFVATNAATACLHQYFDRCFTTMTLIYRKSLVMSNGERAGRTTGDIVNLQSVDAVRIADLAQYGHVAWSGPFQIPINTVIARFQKVIQRKLMKTKDARTRIMNEVLNNIKSIKLYGWEDAFSEKVFEIRNNQELRYLRQIGLVQSAQNFFFTSVPFFVAFATFSTFVYTSDKALTSEIIFPAMSLFTLLSFPMAVFANILNSIIEAVVSVARLESFLAGEELDPEARVVVDPRDDPQGGAKAGEEVVTIKNGEFRWAADSMEPILQDIDLSVTKGELLAVVGRVGDGKSSLLGAILGEMTRSEGSVKLRGDVAYFSQNSWILSATVKDNIIFGHRFDPVFYDQVLDACALRSDLAVLPQGHMTEVGEKGVSLSGGQKARICLARACYARADIYLLDDPLSAVDAHVGRHIFDNVIGPNGLLKGKARIFCTNAVNVLPQTDQVIMLRRGIILERSTYTEAMGNPDTELYKLITGLGKQSAKSGEDSDGSATPTVVEEDEELIDSDGISDKEDSDSIKKMRLVRRMSIATMRRASSVSLGQSKRDAIRDLRESAKPKEHSEKGNVKVEVYKAYISAASKLGVAIFMLAICLGQGGNILSNYVLRFWARKNTEAGASTDIGTYLLAYGVVGIASSTLNVAGIMVLKLYCALRSSKKLHDDSFRALMRSPLSFFELTPTGRILNLFSRDIFVIDEVLVFAMTSFFRTGIQVIGVVVVIALGAPLVLLAFIPLAVLYRIVMRYYLATSRELKRLDAVSRSPVFSFFGETLAGLPVIRAFGQTSRFIANNEARIDRNQACYMPAMTINRWLAVRLEFLGSCLMFSTALVSVSALLISNNVDAGLVGLMMTYTISVTGTLNWFVRSASEVEQNIVSVERVLGYANLDPEAPLEKPDAKPVKTWPQEGSIEFDKFSMRYRPELDLCLKEVSVKMDGGQRIGVVGRTGAGKSSLTLALFRILEASAGRILIDDVDIATIGLHDLRSIVSIIPQDPQLFEGSLRNNIDPTTASSDAEIWQALSQSHLKEHIMDNMGGTLDAEISEGGSNLSSGQRQLVCFARALLRKTKILVLDEATSSIDLETDEAVQHILRGPDFAGVTTITIAHRINTIMDSDKVLVMSEGRVSEFDTPEVLLENPESVFYSLVEEAGLAKK